MTKKDKYVACIREIPIRLEKGGNLIADLGNVAAILNKRIKPYWIGFYFWDGNRLTLGPFQGTPACVFLECGKGVCGTCADQKETILVTDVRQFEGHVACDPNSQSEIVVPCFDEHGVLRAILDVDSDRPAHFDAVDQTYLEAVAELIKPLWKT